VLRSVTPTLSLPVLVVLHLNERFSAAFAEWLDGQSPIRVSYASDKELVASKSGRVVLAPPGVHLIVNDGRLRLTSSAERHACRPSVDVLFESIAEQYGASAVACLLTGMGRDGASGLLGVRAAGGRTIAQDEASSVVYGMPREAAAIGGAEQILPLSQIGPAVTELIRAGGGLQ
jgi:two-component system chemotaxis response regulator CheB